jgi:hypothetical protein
VVALAETEAEFTAALDAAVEGSPHRLLVATPVAAGRPPAVTRIGQLLESLHLRASEIGTVRS